MADCLAVDLTSLEPGWIGGGGQRGTIHPSFCLPWVRGEKVLVGEGAARHRRGSSLEPCHPEARYEPDNAARRAWAEGWLAIGCRPDSLEAAPVDLTWHPPGEQGQLSIPFPRVVRECLERIPAEGDVLGLVVPAGLGPGPRQQLLDALEGWREKTWLFPRTVATALDWCCGSAGRAALEGCATAPGKRVGALLVLTGAADVWEIARVPLRLESQAGRRYLCPVHDRTEVPGETRFVGLAESIARSGVGAKDVASGMLAALHGEALVPSAERVRDVAEKVTKLLRGAHTGTGARPSAEERRAWWERLQELLADDRTQGTLLGVVLAGPWGGTEDLPENLASLVGNCGCSVSLAGPGAPLRGVRKGLLRLADARHPFFEALPPLQILYWGRNSYRDPVPEWLDLLEQAEVPAGRVYESRRPIRGLSVPAGRDPELELVLRTSRFGEPEYRAIREKVRAELREPVPVRITAQVQPGRGLARVSIESEPGGLFAPVIRMDRAALRDEPPSPVYEWPPGSAWIISHETLVKAAVGPLKDLVDGIVQGLQGRGLRLLFRAARECLNMWRLPQDVEPPVDEEHLDYPRDEIHPMFVYLGVIPSAPHPAHPLVEPLLHTLETRLPDVLRRDRYRDIRESILWFSSWLYARCPEGVLDFVRTALLQPEEASGPVFACAGNCFHTAQDYQLFFERVERLVQVGEAEPQYWLRAWRNLSRFRHDALATEFLAADLLERWMDAYLDLFENATPGLQGNNIFLHCCYLAPHLLKRRRFDPRFLEGGSPQATRFAAVLERAARVARSRKHRINAECALAFLNRQADVHTLELLGQNVG